MDDQDGESREEEPKAQTVETDECVLWPDNAIAVTIDIITSIAGRSEAYRAPSTIRESSNAYAKSNEMQPIKPVFSAVTAKMKSVCGSGKNFSTLCDVSESPLIPESPPFPTVMTDCIV